MTPHTGRVLNQVAAAMAAVVLAACSGGSPIAKGSDPIGQVSTVSQLPPNVGPADCNPASPSRPVGAETEVSGQNGPGAHFWALFPGTQPFTVGADLNVVFAVNGAHNLSLIMGGPSGQEVRIDRVSPAFGSSWGRPGQTWLADVNFPVAGCWRISADHAGYHADFWVNAG